MTDNERANKVYLARLKYGKPFIHELPLPKHDISVGRKTPKSEFLKKLESRHISTFAHISYCTDLEKEMIDVYVGNK